MTLELNDISDDDRRIKLSANNTIKMKNAVNIAKTSLFGVPAALALVDAPSIMTAMEV